MTAELIIKKYGSVLNYKYGTKNNYYAVGNGSATAIVKKINGELILAENWREMFAKLLANTKVKRKYKFGISYKPIEKREIANLGYKYMGIAEAHYANVDEGETYSSVTYKYMTPNKSVILVETTGYLTDWKSPLEALKMFIYQASLLPEKYVW